MYFHNSVGNNIYGNLCKRIFFKQPKKNNTLASKEIINGVYIKTGKVVGKFPVYKHERGDVYFHYSSTDGEFFFSTPDTQYESHIGLGAYAVDYRMQNPNRWVYISGKRHDNIFGNIITHWFQHFYSPSNKRIENLDSQLVAKCVNFTDCGSSDLTFTHYYGGQLSVDVFKIFGSVVKSYRQVYVHSTGKLFLFFNNNYWNIGDDYNSMSIKWSVDDQALKPEFITSVWRKWSGIKWEYQYSARVECNGVNKTCAEWNCQNNGRCKSNTFNSSFCLCPFDYTGIKCEKTIRNFCPRTSFTKFSRSQKALESVFCQAGTFYNVVCKKNSTTTSTIHLTKNDSSNQSSTKKKFNADEHNFSFVIFFSIFVPLALPTLIYICCCWLRSSVPYLRFTSLVFYFCKYIVVLLFLDWSRIFNFKISPKRTGNKITVGPCLNAVSSLGRWQQRDETLLL